jgi:hypothetical protein
LRHHHLHGPLRNCARALKDSTGLTAVNEPAIIRVSAISKGFSGYFKTSRVRSVKERRTREPQNSHRMVIVSHRLYHSICDAAFCTGCVVQSTVRLHVGDFAPGDLSEGVKGSELIENCVSEFAWVHIDMAPPETHQIRVRDLRSDTNIIFDSVTAHCAKR